MSEGQMILLAPDFGLVQIQMLRPFIDEPANEGLSPSVCGLLLITIIDFSNISFTHFP